MTALEILTISQDMAQACCEKLHALYGWDMTWKLDGMRIVISCGGVPMEEISIGVTPNAGCEAHGNR